MTQRNRQTQRLWQGSETAARVHIRTELLVSARAAAQGPGTVGAHLTPAT